MTGTHQTKLAAASWLGSNDFVQAYSMMTGPDPSCMRVCLQINASDAILIFDEAHNIEDQARCAQGGLAC